MVFFMFFLSIVSIYFYVIMLGGMSSFSLVSFSLSSSVVFVFRGLIFLSISMSCFSVINVFCNV